MKFQCEVERDTFVVISELISIHLFVKHECNPASHSYSRMNRRSFRRSSNKLLYCSTSIRKGGYHKHTFAVPSAVKIALVSRYGYFTYQGAWNERENPQ